MSWKQGGSLHVFFSRIHLLYNQIQIGGSILQVWFLKSALAGRVSRSSSAKEAALAAHLMCGRGHISNEPHVRSARLR